MPGASDLHLAVALVMLRFTGARPQDGVPEIHQNGCHPHLSQAGLRQAEAHAEGNRERGDASRVRVLKLGQRADAGDVHIVAEHGGKLVSNRGDALLKRLEVVVPQRPPSRVLHEHDGIERVRDLRLQFDEHARRRDRDRLGGGAAHAGGLPFGPLRAGRRGTLHR